ncbi:hypothetical protein [Paramicrobacterium agarici]|uniref:hypothetical protein n=1 Tax=Paramicrobacterium agarici TaxID=630514 RepID=UPI001151E5E6|nr:hypothetical protein [Microbacterium agarici]TQO24246.1 hypothetical protein FB385_3126 [Microbacterium agarici]
MTIQEETLELPSWDEITRRRGRNDLAWLFIDALDSGSLRDEDFCQALQDAWTGPDSPMSYAHPYLWELLFRNVGFLHEDKPGTYPLTGSTILYRGCTESRLYGMSWSERPEVALSFAESYRRQGLAAHVWAAEFKPERALARFTQSRPGEDEWGMEALDDEARAKAWIHTRLG